MCIRDRTTSILFPQSCSNHSALQYFQNSILRLIPCLSLIHILQTIDLKKYYGTEPNITRALNGVNFTVEQGEFVAVVGTSVSGKSTLLHMMGGLDTLTSGSVIVRVEELAKKNDDELTIFRRRNIGFIFQNYNLVPIFECI